MIVHVYWWRGPVFRWCRWNKHTTHYMLGDIWTIELLLCLLNLQITLFPLRCSLRHLALSSHLSLLPVPTHDALSVSQPVPCACAAAAAASATLQKLGKGLAQPWALRYLATVAKALLELDCAKARPTLRRGCAVAAAALFPPCPEATPLFTCSVSRKCPYLYSSEIEPHTQNIIFILFHVCFFLIFIHKLKLMNESHGYPPLARLQGLLTALKEGWLAAVTMAAQTSYQHYTKGGSQGCPLSACLLFRLPATVNTLWIHSTNIWSRFSS